jgi:hypothetical protein
MSDAGFRAVWVRNKKGTPTVFGKMPWMEKLSISTEIYLPAVIRVQLGNQPSY